jgi:hypothetical protein
MTASLTACTLSASTLRYSSNSTEARNMKLPLFQRYPALTYSAAVAASGLSTKVTLPPKFIQR